METCVHTSGVELVAEHIETHLQLILPPTVVPRRAVHLRNEFVPLGEEARQGRHETQRGQKEAQDSERHHSERTLGKRVVKVLALHDEVEHNVRGRLSATRNYPRWRNADLDQDALVLRACIYDETLRTPSSQHPQRRVESSAMVRFVLARQTDITGAGRQT